MQVTYLYSYIAFYSVKDLAPEPDQQMITQDSTDVSTDSGALHDGKNEKGKEKDDKDLEKEKGKEKEADRKGDAEKEKLKGLEGTNLDGLLQRLPGCVSRDLIDQLTVSNQFYVKFPCFFVSSFRWSSIIFYAMSLIAVKA